MIPQTGDIWQFKNSDHPFPSCIVLLHERLREGPSPITLKTEITFRGYDLVSDIYDEYYFNQDNMQFWEKLA